MSGPILSMRREWPWGLVLLTDRDSRDPLPTTLGDGLVASAPTALAVKILHGVDGEATAEVSLDDASGSASPDLSTIWQGQLAVESGFLVIGRRSEGVLATWWVAWSRRGD